MVDISETIKFRDICVMLERVKKASLPSKEKYLRRYYESFLKHREAFRNENGLAGDETGNSSFFCVLRCLIPGSDTSRQPYGLQITSLGKVYIKVLQLAADSRDAERLHARSYSGGHGDYAEIVHSVLKPRVQREPSDFTLKQINARLDTIAEDDRRNTEKVLTELSECLSANEQKWFIRLLLKSMHLGIGEQRILGILHPQAKELYQRCTNLLSVCCLLADNRLSFPNAGEEGSVLAGLDAQAGGAATASGYHLNLNAAIVPFQHIRPMLCEIFPGNIEPLMQSDVLYVETKMDGERFQLHYHDGRFKYISRNSKDYTSNFGSSYESGNLTPLLRDLLPVGLQSIILDGEMMVWDQQRSEFRVKGENTDVKHLAESSVSHWRPCFVAYDILYLDGQSLLDFPYGQRIFKLQELLPERKGILHVMKPTKITSVEDFQKLFQDALNAHEEGVVLKKQNSIYRPGVRNGGGWYKIKADYIEGLTTEFDLLIMGGFYNRTRTWIEAFLVGVLKYENPQKFEVYSVGRVANNTRQREIFNNMLKPHWHQVATEPPPMWYHYARKNKDDIPDVWIEPRRSLIMQIRAADLTHSTAFVLAKCLHFPRIIKWRQDKDWLDCLTLQEFTDIYQGSGRGIKKIERREVELSDLTTNRSKRKLTVAQKRDLGIMAYAKRFQVDEIPKTSEAFAGYSICILSAALKKNTTPEELRAMAISHGAEIIENPIQGDPKCICIAGDLTYRVESLKKARRYNIIKMDWLIRSCDKKQIQALRPTDMICSTDEMMALFRQSYDRYGDAYDEYIEVEELKELIDAISEEDVNNADLKDDDVREVEALLKLDNFFRCHCGFFYSSTQRSQLARCLFEWHGGEFIEPHDMEKSRSCVEYIFIDLDDIDASEFRLWLAQHFESYLQRLKVVNINWVLDSYDAKSKADVSEYTWHDF